jgi:hypothetical protein
MQIYSFLGKYANNRTKKTPQEHNLGASLWFDGAKNRLVFA